MKKRLGFISNSSSSSFIISLHDLSSSQLSQIISYREVCPIFGMTYDETSVWIITTTQYHVKGECSMDNFDMYKFLEEIGINMKHVKWGY